MLVIILLCVIIVMLLPVNYWLYNRRNIDIKVNIPSASNNIQSAAVAQIAARLERRVKLDRQMSSEDAWQDVVTEAVRQLRAL